MKFIANPQIFEKFNNPRIAVTIAKNIDSAGDASGSGEKTEAIIETIRKAHKSETLSTHPKIAAWRDAYRIFGSKPSEFPSSIESLYKRILRGQELGNINPLVDIYNYISLKYMLPAGGEDLDNMQGDIELTFATANETPVVVLGKDEPQAPYEGEVIYKDALGTICRRWNWREVGRTILTPQTKNAILVLEALGPVSDDELRHAQQELGELVQKYCNAVVTSYIVDKNNQSLTI